MITTTTNIPGMSKFGKDNINMFQFFTISLPIRFSPVKCAPGTYSNNGVEPCSPCPVGTYQPGSGQTACLPCPGLKSTHGTGASSDVFCAGTM